MGGKGQGDSYTLHVKGLDLISVSHGLLSTADTNPEH